jgi:hypothetical protein
MFDMFYSTFDVPWTQSLWSVVSSLASLMAIVSLAHWQLAAGSWQWQSNHSLYILN